MDRIRRREGTERVVGFCASVVDGLRLRTLGFFGGSFSSGEDAGCRVDAACEVYCTGSREGDRETDSRDGGFSASRSCWVG